jgi:pentatricopeptide repeat protein
MLLLTTHSLIAARAGNGRKLYSCCDQQWQVAFELLREMQQQYKLVPNIITYNRAINACENGGNWLLAIDLLIELKAAGTKPDKIAYNCVIDALHAANGHEKADEMYLRDA